MPAVLIRQLDALGRIIGLTSAADQRELLLTQAAMILRAGEESVPEAADRASIRRAYDAATSRQQRGVDEIYDPGEPQNPTAA